MITVSVWVEGTTALLQHRATEEGLSGRSRPNNLQEAEDPRDVAERTTYRMDGEGSQLAIPGTAFARMIREAGGGHKAKGTRKSLKYLVPAAVLVMDDLCGLYLKDRRTEVADFEVDSRPVTIPATKGRVMRHRPRINEWTCMVTLRINESLMSEGIVRQLFAEGGQQIGVGDFRPEKGGPFGTFSVVGWDVVAPEEPRRTPARKRNAG